MSNIFQFLLQGGLVDDIQRDTYRCEGLYNSLVLSEKLNSYLADLNEQAEDMFFRLVKDITEKNGITETLKAEDQMLWVQRMNAVREAATEIVNHDLIYA